ncbi:MAG: acetyl-CoA carboxylase biotin carboxyl carrier protein subunit [Bacteriovorax sp.]
MRTYLIDNEKNEYVVDLIKTRTHSAEMAEFEFRTIKDNQEVNKETVFIRKLADQYFASTDGIKWNKLARQDSPSVMLNVDKVFKLYSGYKPSSLGGDNSGGLFTQMPGKVVKILAKLGDKVEKGQTLLILEAMKMENEIKSGTSGVVKAIHVKAGDALENGILMMEVEAE